MNICRLKKVIILWLINTCLYVFSWQSYNCAFENEFVFMFYVYVCVCVSVYHLYVGALGGWMLSLDHRELELWVSCMIPVLGTEPRSSTGGSPASHREFSCWAFLSLPRFVSSLFSLWMNGTKIADSKYVIHDFPSPKYKAKQKNTIIFIILYFLLKIDLLKWSLHFSFAL